MLNLRCVWNSCKVSKRLLRGMNSQERFSQRDMGDFNCTEVKGGHWYGLDDSAKCITVTTVVPKNIAFGGRTNAPTP